MRMTIEENQKQYNKNECFALWKHQGKNGEYLTGKTVGTETVEMKLVGFFNTNKKNPKEPDIQIYESVEGKKGERICVLWENISKNEVRYLSGKTNSDKVVAYYNRTENEKQPFIKGYFKEENK